MVLSLLIGGITLTGSFIAFAKLYARSVVIVPGDGMAVAQAQHSVRELADRLELLGVDIKQL